jgi:protein TonB
VSNLINEPSSPSPASASTASVSNNLNAAIPIAQASPVFPELALRTRASGQVVLELQIDDQGKVVKAAVMSGPGIFHSAAVAAAMKWRYKPASIGGVNVASQSRVTMSFNLKK